MTTTVQIVVPEPNHKRVQVWFVDPATNFPQAGKLPVILEPGESLTEYVHGGSRLIVDEVD